MEVLDKPLFPWGIDGYTRDPNLRFFRNLMVATALCDGASDVKMERLETFMHWYRPYDPNRLKYAALFLDSQDILFSYHEALKGYTAFEQYPGWIMLRAGDFREGWDRLCAVIDMACMHGLQYGRRGPTCHEAYWRYGNDGPISVPSYDMFKDFVEKFDAGYLCASMPGYRRELDFETGDKASDPGRAENARMRDQLTKDSGFPYRVEYGEYLRYLDTVRPRLRFGSSVGTVDVGVEDLRNLCLPMDCADYGSVTSSFSATHTYVVGRSGSGKTELLKAVCHATYDVPKVVLDPHGDLADELADRNAFPEQDFLTAAPLERRFVINPFDLADKDARSVDLAADEIVQLVCDLVEDVGLSRQMKLVAFPLVRTLLRLPYADFSMFAECLNPESGNDRLASISHAVDDADRDVWEALAGSAYDTTKRSVYTRLRSILNSGVVRETLSGKDDFGSAMDTVLSESMGLVFSIPIPDMGEEASRTLGKFFMTRMQIWAKRRRALPKEEREPVYLVVDEFQNFLGSSTADTLDQFGRKFGLFMVLAHQHTSQLSERDIRGSVLANCGNKIAGMADRATRKAMADEMGISAEDLETLGTGWWYGTFVESPMSPFRFYMNPVPASDSRSEKSYAPSANGDRVEDGWKLAGTVGAGGDAESGRTAARARAGTAKASVPNAGSGSKPAFEL